MDTLRIMHGVFTEPRQEYLPVLTHKLMKSGRHTCMVFCYKVTCDKQGDLTATISALPQVSKGEHRGAS